MSPAFYIFIGAVGLLVVQVVVLGGFFAFVSAKLNREEARRKAIRRAEGGQ